MVDAGAHTTIQDRGRFGWEHLGIAQGGASDDLALLWVNRLAGNPDDRAVLECVLRGFRLVPALDMWIATAGARDVAVGGRRFPRWAGFHVRAGSEVQVSGLTGARAYLAVHGGLDGDVVLGSRSTHLEAGFGGFGGRALRAGDDVPVLDPESGMPEDELWRCARPPVLSGPVTARAVPGPVEDAWSDETRRWLQETTFTVMPQSNHVGVRLTGGVPPTLPSGDGISEPQPVGAIQVAPMGEAIVLGRARGTIGGYPSPATVIGPDMWKFGQVRPGDTVRFELLDVRTAGEEARAERERRSLMQPQRIRLRRERG